MRRIRETVLPFTGNNDDRLPKTVREYRQKYKGVSRILDAHPEVLAVGRNRIAIVDPGTDRFVHVALVHINSIEALQTA